MRKLLTFLFTIFTFAGFSQGVTVTVGGISATATNTDSLGGKGAAFYVDTATAQNIEGVKSFKNILNADSINITSQLTLNDISADSMITLANVTGNIANSTTKMDTVFTGVVFRGYYI